MDDNTFERHLNYVLSSVPDYQPRNTNEEEIRRQTAIFYLDRNLNNALEDTVLDFKKIFKK